jgi:hypothetical protein
MEEVGVISNTGGLCGVIEAKAVHLAVKNNGKIANISIHWFRFIVVSPSL